MPPALLERHGINPEEVKPISDAFAEGDVRRALQLTPDDVANQLMLAGTPDDWIQWLKGTYAPADLNHALVSFTDPFTLESWASIRIDGLPSLSEQVRLVGEHVLPAIA
jgi:5,10-methylenetetrahydromethanopterin reductase